MLDNAVHFIFRHTKAVDVCEVHVICHHTDVHVCVNSTLEIAWAGAWTRPGVTLPSPI